MKDYLEKDPWKIIEKGFNPEYNRITESIMSIGNGYMGQRANFEEYYAGDTMQGSYLAGIYYPDKTRVGWWKNGYPEYFAKVLNSVNWIGIDIFIEGTRLDLSTVKMLDFQRELDMQKSLLSKKIRFQTTDGHIFQIESERFCSWSRKELGCIYYKLSSENFNGKLSLDAYLDFDIYNEDANYDEQFWEAVAEGDSKGLPYVQAKTKKTEFEVRAIMHARIMSSQSVDHDTVAGSQRSASHFTTSISAGESITVEKRVVIVSSFHMDRPALAVNADKLLEAAIQRSYKELKAEQVKSWEEIWNESDIEIDGDVAAQQGIRFNIFHLHQTYSGDDPRLNIGPKGFTGEKYGGSTYWDTEAYCLPFYLSNSDEQVARNLLAYRYNHLGKAIENAKKLGFTNGAALYPMVTMNGEECHNEWEITFEEIHRNGAIAYAIMDYTRYTGDNSYRDGNGLEVLVAISRFWAQRVNFSEEKGSYVILGVTGPNEYENNVNNNWYTNYMASWFLGYTLEVLDGISVDSDERYNQAVKKLELKSEELDHWQKIVDNMYYPYDPKREIYLQQDGFLDKELMPVSKLDTLHLPLNQNWSWDRILRSCYIKQADVLQGLYFFEENFDKETIWKHFDFYEPITVHESSLSPCVHAILACRIERFEKAYEMYLRTARLDLDDYNNDTEDGLHITSMAGTWMSVVKGFAGMKIIEGTLAFDPYIPEQWKRYAFRVRFRSNVVSVEIAQGKLSLNLLQGRKMAVLVSGKEYDLELDKALEIDN